MTTFAIPAEVDTLQASEDGRWCQILNPLTAAPVVSHGVQVRFLVWGPDSSAYRRAEKAARKKITELREQGADEDESLDQFRLEMLAHLIKAWDGVYDVSGAAVTPAVETARELLKAVPLYRFQLERFADDRARFTAASSNA